MITVVRYYEHVSPLHDKYVIFQVIKTFKECNKQTQKEAMELAISLSKKGDYEYKVLIDLSCITNICNPE